MPSDQLPRLREFLSTWPALKEIFGDLLRLQLGIDASVVNAELRWRLAKRRDPAARTGLNEAIDSGAVVAFAPPALEREIQEHVGEIAEYAHVPVDRVLQEWQQFRKRVHFYDPDPSTPPEPDCVDPDDLPYKLVCEQLGAHAVYSRDHHLRQMSVPVIWVRLDLTIRDYARASSVRLTLQLGTGFSFMIGFGALVGFVKACRACLRILGQLPNWAKLIVAAGALLVIVHPKFRVMIADLFQSGRRQFENLTPALGEAFDTFMRQLAVADATAKNSYTEILSKLPATRKRSAVVMARSICLLNKEPLSLKEIEARMRKEGYVSKSRDFKTYLWRLLRNDGRFVEVYPGHWTISAERVAASG